MISGETVNPLLDEVERRACRYFYDHSNPATGLVRDRARANGPEHRRVASIAATGFGLSALCIGDLRGYLPRGAAKGRVTRMLESLLRRVEHERGFFYHFLDMPSGARIWGSEASSIDTAWLLCGALHCRAHFDTPAIRQFSDDLMKRVEWRWMLNGGSTLSHGWMPETGFLPYRWDSYSELMAMYLLAIGSTESAIPASCWDNWARPLRSLERLTFIDADAPLFTHQYSHAWFDFRGRTDRYADYFENSRMATIAHRRTCLRLAGQYPCYGADLWGVTASDSANGYRTWISSGCPANGTLVPCAAAGSMPFAPAECAAVLGAMIRRFGPRVWGRYGFVDAFQPDANWFNPDVLGINLGISLLMIENARSAAVWEAVMSSPEAHRGIELAGFTVA